MKTPKVGLTPQKKAYSSRKLSEKIPFKKGDIVFTAGLRKDGYPVIQAVIEESDEFTCRVRSKFNGKEYISNKKPYEIFKTPEDYEYPTLILNAFINGRNIHIGELTKKEIIEAWQKANQYMPVVLSDALDTWEHPNAHAIKEAINKLSLHHHLDYEVYPEGETKEAYQKRCDEGNGFLKAISLLEEMIKLGITPAELKQ